MDKKDQSALNMISLPSLNNELHGPWRMKLTPYRRSLRDLMSYAYLLGHFKLRSFYNFLYTKAVVPTGEGSHLNLASLLARLKTDRADIPVPRFIEMETTTVCNKRCKICEYVYWAPGEQVRRHMSLEEFKHIVNQFPKLRWVNLTGEGSSFLNPDYPAMLRYLWDKDRTSIWLVDHLDDISFEDLVSDVFPYIHGIYVSMDAATKETYENIKVGCTFESVVNNLQKIVAYKQSQHILFPHIAFRYIITNENLREMPLFLDLLNSIAKPSAWGGSSSFVEFAGLLAFPEIQQYYIDHIPFTILDELRQRRKGIEFYFSHPEESRNPPCEECTAWLEPYIMMPGYVVPCCAVMMSNRRPFLREYSFGNVLNEDFSEIWRSDYYRGFRQKIMDPEASVPKICVGCRAFRTEHRVSKYGIWDIRTEDGAGRIAQV
ncbi:MAG: SPASM domain-containing protein [Syntrophaceae bacterium]|nr:SPASM domain-containing protein [Syntrophaceae bacterium]